MAHIFLVVLAFLVAPSLGVAFAVAFMSVGDGWNHLGLPSWFVYAFFTTGVTFVIAYWLASRAGVTEQGHKLFGQGGALLLLVTICVAFISGVFEPTDVAAVPAAGPNDPLMAMGLFFDDFVPQMLRLCMGLGCFIFAATAIHMLMLTIRAYRSITF